jgi:Fe2+ or Zn2+ uptake regulation protein
MLLETNMYKQDACCDAKIMIAKTSLPKTAQRMAVLRILLRVGRPVCVTEILDQLKEEKLKINKVTIYRIINSFKREALIREIATCQGIHYYEAACVHHPVHPHLNCRLCGGIFCIAPFVFLPLRGLLSKKYDFSMEQINVNITGVCSLCLNKRET